MPPRGKAPAASVLGKERPIRPITHLSYSTLDSWFRCPKAVQLSKERLAPRTTAWWFAGGSAVHAASDAYDRWSELDPLDRPRFALQEEWERAFDAEVREIESQHPDRSLWRAAGSKETPETYDRWKNALGPELVAAYIRWRRRTAWVLWHTAAGEPAIELDLSTTFPGCEREVKAYADRIFFDPALEQYIIVDFKSGTRAPEGPLQFGTYAAAMRVLHGKQCAWGYPFMNRKAQLGRAFDLSRYTPVYIGRQYAALGRAMDQQVFPAHVSGACKMCDVQSSCYAKEGEFSKLYDPDDPEYDVPF